MTEVARPFSSLHQVSPTTTPVLKSKNVGMITSTRPSRDANESPSWGQDNLALSLIASQLPNRQHRGALRYNYLDMMILPNHLVRRVYRRTDKSFINIAPTFNQLRKNSVTYPTGKHHIDWSTERITGPHQTLHI